MANLIGYLVYLFFTQTYFVLIYVIAPFNKRAKKLASGQKKLKENIANAFLQNKQPIIWFHVASLGEFEQGKPLMEALKKQLPDHKLLVTFFSPSGYENRKNDSLIDYAFYLPFDGPLNARIFLKYVKPVMAFWVKYDFWFHYLNRLNKQKIPVYLTSALFIPTQIYFKFYGNFYAKLLTLFTNIYCQNEGSKKLLKTLRINSLVTGDLRYDNVIAYGNTVNTPKFIEPFTQNKFTIIAGSSYNLEETMLANVCKNFANVKLIIAPHFVEPNRVLEIEKTFIDYKTIVYSKIKENADLGKYQVLVVDTIGLLAALYKSGTIAFVGGGFWQSGLHNILEPSVFGLPICFGGKIDRFPEAEIMVNNQLASIIKTENNLQEFIGTYFNDQENLQLQSTKIKEFIQTNAGSTKKIMDDIFG